MNITMTLEEYKDLKSRCVTKDEWKAKEDRISKAALDFAKRIAESRTYSNLQDMSHVVSVALEEFAYAIKSCFYPEEPNL